MPGLRGLTASVGYGDLLAITLPMNMRHFSECIVVTSPEDEQTQEVARSIPGVRLSITDAATRHGASFNKGLLLEEGGFEFMGRHGCILIHDSDILLPDELPLHLCKPNTLHGARRRIVADPASWKPETPWQAYPHAKDGGPVGFFQLFHAESTPIVNRRPWYNVNYPHAGGGDAYFMDLFPPNLRCVLPVDVLHFGLPDRNWFGRDPAGRDKMSAFAHRMQWRRAMQGADPTAAARVGEMPERVDVPGYETSTYQMPFEKRAARKP